MRYRTKISIVVLKLVTPYTGENGNIINKLITDVFNNFSWEIGHIVSFLDKKRRGKGAKLIKCDKQINLPKIFKIPIRGGGGVLIN